LRRAAVCIVLVANGVAASEDNAASVRANDVRTASLADRDADGAPDDFDNCSGIWNPDQVNSDGDRFGDRCDNCPYVQNDDQKDRNGDGVGNRCTYDVTGDGFTDERDVRAFAAALDGAYTAQCDLDDDGRVDLLDLALFAQVVRIGIASDDLWDFTYAFIDHSRDGGGIAIPQGMNVSAIPGSNLIVFPGRSALLVRSGPTGDTATEGVLTSRPFVPRGPRLTVAVLSESSDVQGTVRILRPTRTPAAPPPESVLIEEPLRNDTPGTGVRARFASQTVDLSPWFNREHPLRSERIQVQFRQRTTRPGAGYFTLIGDVRTGP
jgi:hypothetical protein